jgi:hypothetical protein
MLAIHDKAVGFVRQDIVTRCKPYMRRCIVIPIFIAVPLVNDNTGPRTEPPPLKRPKPPPLTEVRGLNPGFFEILGALLILDVLRDPVHLKGGRGVTHRGHVEQERKLSSVAG